MPSAQVLISGTSAPPLQIEHATPLHEFRVMLNGTHSELALLDEGSEIVVIQEDVWRKTNAPINQDVRMRIQTTWTSTPISRLFPSYFAESLLQAHFDIHPIRRTFAYKKVANKTHSSPPITPVSMPGTHFTKERMDELGIFCNKFLWPVERKLAAHVLTNNKLALAWDERSNSDSDSAILYHLGDIGVNLSEDRTSICPQFAAIASQLTASVWERLMIYGRLKGLNGGHELKPDVEALVVATNQRKLSLAIALIGKPSVVLIDEFSTGVDAKMIRDMWSTLQNVAVKKATAITTHSMEEASALANRVGIISKQLLAVGTIDDPHPCAIVP
ncbi:hypothetical protein P692DRAFT_20878557 [Suillus brevipes Sb2]|nr:hypothetical protein P692DRAFT_20878557 [Suillus brevipes Sb2]